MNSLLCYHNCLSTYHSGHSEMSQGIRRTLATTVLEFSQGVTWGRLLDIITLADGQTQFQSVRPRPLPRSWFPYAGSLDVNSWDVVMIRCYFVKVYI